MLVAMILTVAAIKGGVGKTTLSMGLAETLSRALPDGDTALLLDMDPQGSATGFKERTDGLVTRVKQLSGRSAGQLARLIRDETAGERLVVIDTPPGNLDITDAAIGESDFVLVPTEPYLDPLTQAIETLAMTDGIPAAIVLNLVNQSANDAEAARSVLAGAEKRVLRMAVPNWVSIARIDGASWPPEPKIESLFRVLAEELMYEFEATGV